MPPPHNHVGELNLTSAAVTTYGVLYGLHMARFASPGLRWALFGFGLLGCLMIATGMVLWSVKRSAQAQRKVATQATRPAATAAGRAPGGRTEHRHPGGPAAGLRGVLAANRLLPLELPQRADTELACFFATWGLAWCAGLLCPAAWAGRQCWAWLLRHGRCCPCSMP